MISCSGEPFLVSKTKSLWYHRHLGFLVSGSGPLVFKAAGFVNSNTNLLHSGWALAPPFRTQATKKRNRGDGSGGTMSAWKPFFANWLVEVGFGFFVPCPVVLLFLLCVLRWPLVPPFRNEATKKRNRGDRSLGTNPPGRKPTAGHIRRHPAGRNRSPNSTPGDPGVSV